jgi:hypothetical protein
VRKRRLIAATSVTLLALGAYVVASDSHNRKDRFETRLQGFQENPSNSTTGRGHAEIRIDDDAQTITFEVTYDGLEGVGTTPFVTNGVVTQSHIHVSSRHVNVASRSSSRRYVEAQARIDAVRHRHRRDRARRHCRSGGTGHQPGRADRVRGTRCTGDSLAAT